jgi:uncharacterized protein (TIGR00255 family)
MLRSMTGFGTAEGPLAGGRIGVEVRTVNHRHFNPQFRLPIALQRFESQLREWLRTRITRGNVALNARWSLEPPGATAIHVDVDRARAVATALEDLKRELGLPGEIDLAFVARQPDVLKAPEERAVEVEPEEFLTVVAEAVDDVIAMREREGRALAEDLAGRLDAIEGSLDAVEARAPERLVQERDRLRETVRELLASRTVNEERLELELALLAEKLDVAEEIVRLRTHVSAVRDALTDNEPVGRRLSFLGQEMLREINTIGSKANDAEIVRHVIDMKCELEKFREQVENVE